MQNVNVTLLPFCETFFMRPTTASMKQTPKTEHAFTWGKYDITNLSGTSTASEVMNKISYENIMKAITKELYPTHSNNMDKDEGNYYITPEGITRIPFSEMNSNNVNHRKMNVNFYDSHPSSRSLTASIVTESTPNNSPIRSHDIHQLRSDSNKEPKHHRFTWGK